MFSQIYFNNRYDGAGSWDICTSIVDADSGYILAGKTDPTKIFTMFIDTLGIKKWNKIYNIQDWPFANIGYGGSLLKTKDFNFAITGQLKADTNYAESFLMKIKPNGDTIWTRAYRLNYPNYYSGASQCKQTSDKGYVIAGIYDCLSTTISCADFLLIKTDSMGFMEWNNNYGDDKIELAYSVTQTKDKGFLLGGQRYYGGGGTIWHDAKIVKTDSMGNEQWERLLGNPNVDDGPAYVCLSQDSNLIVGYAYGIIQLGMNISKRKINVVKIDNYNNIIWDKKYGSEKYDNYVSNIKLLPSGGFIVVGNYAGVEFTDPNSISWILCINANGDSLWYREYYKLNFANCTNSLFDITNTKDNGFAAAGHLYPASTGGTDDAWVIKTDSFGCLEADCTVGIIEIKENKGMVIYPNPARDKITFQLNQKDLSDIKLVIYNLQGQILMQKDLVQNNTEIDVSQLPQGIYVAKVSFGDGSYTQGKFVVVK